MEPQTLGKMLLLAGAVLVVVGVGLLVFDKIPFLGKLPGDIVIKREHFQVYIPITTSIVLSVIISLVVWVVSHGRGK